jgi:hypothetical protein
LPDVAVPKSDELIEINQSKILDGVSLKVLALVPPGSLTITNGDQIDFVPARRSGAVSNPSPYLRGGSSVMGDTHTSDLSTLVVEVAGLQSDDELHVQTPGPENKPWIMRSIFGKQTLKQHCFIDVDWDPSLTTIHLELRISRPLRFQFFINPTNAFRSAL